MKNAIPEDVLTSVKALIAQGRKRTDAYNRLIDAHANKIDACNSAWNKKASLLYIPTVAVGAFMSILNGDDLYQINLGSMILLQMGMNANLPTSPFPTPELDDEEV